MNFVVKCLIIASFFLFSNQSFSQKNKIDSLKNQLLLIKSDSSKVKLWSSLGSFYADAKQIDSSVYFSQLAIDFYKRNKNLKAVSYEKLILGYRYKNIYKFPEAKRHFIESLNFATQIKNENYKISAYEGLGWLSHEMGNHLESIDYFREALTIAKYLKDEERIVEINTYVANNYIAMGKYEDAQEQYLKAANYYKKKKNLKSYASHLSTYGNLFRKINESHNAEKPLLAAYKIQKQINDKWSLIDGTRFLGMLYTETKDFKKAAMFFEESQNLAKELNDNSSMLKLYYTLERFYYIKNDIKNGDKYQKLILKMRDSLYTTEKNKQLSEFDIKYKTAEKEAKLKAAQLENAQKRNWIIGLSLALLGILVSGGLLWRISSIKRKATENEKLKNIEIENQKKLLSAKEIERQRIAKELHDSVGSQLTVVSTSLDNAFYLFENQKLLPEKLENISGEVRLAAQSLRDTIWATYNSEISVADLRSRIQEFVKKFSDENSFNVEIYIKGEEVVLTPIQGLNLFRIVQEALNNTQKYASASLVKINADFSEKNYFLEITDNGKGFDLEQNKVTESYGLNNMKTRAEEIEAKLEIKSSLGGGTAIIFEKV
ncbi:sensor histidine kinase [Lacihabitans sp. CS3-21]|uniref:tetratricopeptide repeat-containing sensor histidine kinase n=1 Tax=Lacihabitans sp. CS3-21 TaxID=2487332 RepID=UPI0020CD3B5B|nr:sensor histidine kinase [Lacihabitans sp. CS3-21]MCP9745145.1 hypothetical protein [Lacihabitans sp. CS3-21]